MTDIQYRMLSRFNGFTRDYLYFTGPEFSMTERAAKRNLADVLNQGLIVKAQGQGYRLSRKGGEALRAADAANALSLSRICNSSSKQPYVPPVWNVRAGGNDALAIKTRGTLC